MPRLMNVKTQLLILVFGGLIPTFSSAALGEAPAPAPLNAGPESSSPWTLSAANTPLNQSDRFSPSAQAGPARPGPSNHPESDFIARILQAKEGLSVNVIDSIQQTPDGFLWLGTPRGLIRFDGLQFQPVAVPADSPAPSAIHALAVDGRGQLWLAEQSGLVHLDHDGGSQVFSNPAVPPAPIDNLCRYNNGLLWVNTNGTLGRISTEPPFQMEPWAGDFPAGARLMCDSKDQLWLTSPLKIMRYQAGKWRDIDVPGGGTLEAAPRRAGGLWVARGGVLRSISEDGSAKVEIAFAWNNLSRVSCMLEDKHQRLWIGTDSQGIFCFSSGTIKHLVPTASRIACLFEDAEENIWAGTHGGGLIQLIQRQFFAYELGGGYENGFVRSISPDPGGQVWAISANGEIGRWQDGFWHLASPAEGWPGYKAWCLFPANGGGIWISTETHGLWRWTNGVFEPANLKLEANGQPFVNLFEDRLGRLWLLNKDYGIYCKEGTKLTHYTPADGLPKNCLRLIAEDEQGGIWVGDWKGGIARLNDQRWETVHEPTDFKDAIQSLVVAKGTLWASTSSGNLLCLKDRRTHQFSAEQGLPEASIQHLLLDDQGALWGTTSHRLFQIPASQLNALISGDQPRVNPIFYGPNDGLPNVLFANLSSPAGRLTEEGELWFSTAQGAIHFRPADLPNNTPPQAVIDKIWLNARLAPASALQNLRPGPTRLQFEFTAPCLTTPDRIRFRYQLSGVNSDWVDASSSRSASYTDLPRGKHTFRVLCSSPEGEWSNPAAGVTLTVRPYFWQTNAFLVLLIAGITGGGAWMARRYTARKYRQRLDQLQQLNLVEQERLRIARDLHDELGANLTSIGLLADLGARHKLDPATIATDLEQISRAARESVIAMDAIVWALNPHKDSLDNFANYVAQFTRDFFRPTHLRTRLDLPENLPSQRMPTEIRHQLFLIIKELYNNIARHAEATEVRLKLACEYDCLHLHISDNGKGLPEQPEGEDQQGLESIRQRIENLAGHFQMDSQPGGGTRFVFTIPLKGL